MAFRALLFSKSPETDAAMTAACKSTGIGAEVCSDIFSAIAKGTKRSYSCLIADWADQPEASFLFRRARESAPNRDTVAIAIVDHDPTPAELRDNRLDFLIYRPISDEEATAVLAKASEQMQPLSAEEAESPAESDASSRGPSAVSADPDGSGHSQPDQSANFQEENAAEANGGGDIEGGERRGISQARPRGRFPRRLCRDACAYGSVLPVEIARLH